MKLFVVALAIACVAAEPAADSDPLYVSTYGNIYGSGLYGSGLYGYSSPLLTGLTGYSTINPYNRIYAPRVIGKREADSDSEADPALLVNPYFGSYGLRSPVVSGLTGYSSLGYSNLAYPYSTINPYSRFYTSRIIGKREADSDSEADPALLVNPYFGNYGLRSPVVSGLTGYSTLGYSNLAYPYSTINPYRSYYAPRVIGKREADSDPALVYRNPITDFHTNVANLNKGINLGHAASAVGGQIYNSVRVPSAVYTTGYATGYSLPYATGYAARPYYYL